MTVVREQLRYTARFYAVPVLDPDEQPVTDFEVCVRRWDEPPPAADDAGWRAPDVDPEDGSDALGVIVGPAATAQDLYVYWQLVGSPETAGDIAGRIVLT